jgi:hypothetical protein
LTARLRRDSEVASGFEDDAAEGTDPIMLAGDPLSARHRRRAYTASCGLAHDGDRATVRH